MKIWFLIIGWLGVIADFPGAYAKDLVPSQTPMPIKTLPDISLGSLQSPITVVMYFAPTCNHCAQYEQNILPDIQKDFINAGKVHFIMRLLPFHRLDYFVAKLVWSRGEEKIFQNVQLFLSHQKDWLEPALEDIKERRKVLQETVKLAAEETRTTAQALMDELNITLEDEDAFLKIFALKNGFTVEEIHQAQQENTNFEEALTANHLQAAKDFGKSLDYVPAFMVNGTPKKGWVRPKDLIKAFKKNANKKI